MGFSYRKRRADEGRRRKEGCYPRNTHGRGREREKKTRAPSEGQLDNGVMHASMTRTELEDRNGEPTEKENHSDGDKEYGQRPLHTGTGYRAEETHPVMESS